MLVVQCASSTVCVGWVQVCAIDKAYSAARMQSGTCTGPSPICYTAAALYFEQQSHTGNVSGHTSSSHTNYQQSIPNFSTPDAKAIHTLRSAKKATENNESKPQGAAHNV